MEQETLIGKLCEALVNLTASEKALLGAILIQATWIVVGSITKWDPFPFSFLLTCSNIIQLILIFVVAVAQKKSEQKHQEHREAVTGALAEVHGKLDQKLNSLQSLHDILQNVHGKVSTIHEKVN